MSNVSGAKAKKHLREFNKQVRKELISGIHKMDSEKAVTVFKKLFEPFQGGFRPKMDLDELRQGQNWDFDAFRNIMKKKERKKPEKKPKPDTPKPKPDKPKPADPKPDPAPQLTPQEIEQKQNELIVDEMLKLSDDTQSSFVCYDFIENYIFLKILERNKNDCVMMWNYSPKGKLEKIDAGGNRRDRNIIPNVFSTRRTTLTKDDYVQKVVEQLNKCVSGNKKKLLVIPLEIVGGGHLNMLIINPYLHTVEWYEPHGEQYGGTKKAQNTREKVDKQLEAFTKKLNKERSIVGVIDKNPPKKEYTYSSSTNACPRIPKEIFDKLNKWSDKKKLGFQSIEQQGKRGAERVIEGRIFKNTGGFCCMWSFLQMEFRLKRPSVPENELASILFDKIKSDPAKFSKMFIQGYAEDLMTDIKNELTPAELNSSVNRLRRNNPDEKFYSQGQDKLRKMATTIFKRIISQA